MTRGPETRLRGTAAALPIRMWILLAIALVAGWVVLNVAWDIASFAVHLLLALAALAVIAHLVRGRFGRRSATADT